MIVLLKLTELLKEKNLTEAELARQLGCVQSTIFHWKVGTYLPHAKYLVSMCQILDCSADDLLGIEREKPRQLDRQRATELLKAVTRKGQYDATVFHQMATKIRQSRANKVTEFEKWLRDLAEVVYKIEISAKTKTSTNVSSQAVQLRLL